jgi:hypothetical protein
MGLAYEGREMVSIKTKYGGRIDDRAQKAKPVSPDDMPQDPVCVHYRDTRPADPKETGQGRIS